MMPTPFTAGGEEIDASSLRNLASTMSARGCDVLVVHGVVAEPETLTLAEKRSIVAIVLEEISTSVVPTIMSGETVDAVAEAKMYREVFGDSLTHLMLPVTAITTASASAHLGAIVDASGYRIVLQDYPKPTGIHIGIDELRELVESNDHIDAVKEEAPDASHRIAVLGTVPGLNVVGGLGGIDSVEYLQAGAWALAAGISVPHVLAGVLADWETNNTDGAKARLRMASDLIRFEASSSRSVGIRKEHWRRQGVIGHATVRRPDAGWLSEMDRSTSVLLAPWLPL